MSGKDQKKRKKKRSALEPPVETRTTNKGGDRAKWTDAEVKKMLKELGRLKSERGDGTSFKMSTFNKVANTLNPPHSGAEKDGKMCRTKYNTLKKSWQAIIVYINKSGQPPWDKDRGADIENHPEHQSVWDAAKEANPILESFENVGFQYHDEFETLLPLSTSRPRGINVFRPGLSVNVEDDDLLDGDASADEEIDDSQSPQAEGSGSRQSIDQDESQSEQDSVVQRAGSAEQPPISRTPSTSSFNTGVDEGEKPTSSSGRKRAPTSTPLPGSTSDKRAKDLATPAASKPSKPAPPATDKARAVFAMESVGARIGEFNEAARNLLAPPPSSTTALNTPQRLTDAINASKREKDWLPIPLRLKFQDILQADKMAVVTYTALDPDDVEYRKQWILSKLGLTAPVGYNFLVDTMFPGPASQANEYDDDFGSFNFNDYSPANMSQFLPPPSL